MNKERIIWALTNNFPSGFFQLWDSLVMIFTFGFICPGTTFTFIAWRLRIEFAMKLKRGESIYPFKD